MKLNPFSLSFSHDRKELEQEFFRDYFDNYLSLFRVCHFYSIFFNGMFGITDALASGGSDSAPGLCPGKYLELSAADTGRGMDPETIGQIFDPYFFYNQSPGQGSGCCPSLPGEPDGE